jgi:hypothetical protein
MDKGTAALKDNDCIEEFHIADLEESCNAISTRWVCSQHTVGFYDQKGMRETRFHARPEARGYEDAEIENISSDSSVVLPLLND